MPGREFRGRVRFIDPVVDPATRTARVRIELPNANGALKPGMFAHADLQLDLGERLVVPRSALLDTGTRQVVYVKTGDASFAGREVRVGERAGDLVEVVEGLAEGEEVVAAASFLVDSQSQLQTGASVQWGGASRGEARMIAWLIDASLRNRFLVLAVVALVVAAGIYAARTNPVDAIPDLSETQVIVFAEWPGRSPQEVEDQVTYPMVVNLRGLAGVRAVRSSSAFGFAMVNVIYEDGTDLYFARQRILERMNLIQAQMPGGVVPVLGPDASAVGQVLWYALDADGHDLGELRALQDFFVRYQLNAVPGVAEVASIGGFVREYQVDLDPRKLDAYGVSLRQVLEAVERSNRNVGGKVVEQHGMEYVVRGIGLIEAVPDIERIAVGAAAGTPVYLSQLGTVQLGPAFRRGALEKDGREVVGGVVTIRYGESAPEILRRVKAKIAEIQSGLPPGVRIVPFYDRSGLIARAVGTLRRALIEETLLVVLAHVLFLAHFRSILIVSAPLPIAVLISFLLMRAFGITSNIMSLMGIAIAIGVLVDAGIVITENCFRRLELDEKEGRRRPADRSGARGVAPDRAAQSSSRWRSSSSPSCRCSPSPARRGSSSTRLHSPRPSQ